MKTNKQTSLIVITLILFAVVSFFITTKKTAPPLSSPKNSVSHHLTQTAASGVPTTNTQTSPLSNLPLAPLDQTIQPFKSWINSIRGKESLDYDSFKNGIQSILDDLNTQHNGVFKELLEDFIDRITLFGFYFATLDYRQDRSVIEKTLQHVLLETLLEQDVTADTLFNNEKAIDILPSTDDRIGDTLETFKTIKKIQETN